MASFFLPVFSRGVAAQGNGKPGCWACQLLPRDVQLDTLPCGHCARRMAVHRLPLQSRQEINTASKDFKGGFFGCPEFAQRIGVVAKNIEDRLVGGTHKSAARFLEPRGGGFHVDANGHLRLCCDHPAATMRQAAMAMIEDGLSIGQL